MCVCVGVCCFIKKLCVCWFVCIIFECGVLKSNRKYLMTVISKYMYSATNKLCVLGSQRTLQLQILVIHILLSKCCF